MESIKPIVPPTIINNEDIYQNVRDMVHEAFFIPNINRSNSNETEARIRIQAEILKKRIDKEMCEIMIKAITPPQHNQ